MKFLELFVCLIILITLILLINYFIKKSNKNENLLIPETLISLTKTKKDFELVIARYKEDISWSDNYKQFRTIYNKGPDDLPGVEYIKRENYGQDCEVFLYHIINNYYNLSNVTMFFQGTYNDREDQIIKNIKKFISDDPNYIYYENKRSGDLPDNNKTIRSSISLISNKNTENIDIENFDKIYKKIFNKNYNKNNITWTPGMYISVGKNKIQNQPQTVYIKMYNFLMENKYNKNSTKLRVYIIERLLLHCFINK